MGKLAFLFPGQGSQKVGMGAELAESHADLYSRYVDQASEASGLPVRELALEGPIERLTETNAAQPALFSLSLALNEAARELGLRPDFVAGHSLGEYTAAVAAGALGAEDGMRVVARRGALMHAAQTERPGAMGAVIGLAADQLEELCAQARDAGVVTLANLNSPAQIVVSGEEAAVERVIELAGEAGAKRALRLQVGAAFHSELMQPVQAQLDELMQTLDWKDTEVPLASNASGTLIQNGEEVHQALVAQIASPVRWVDCVKALVDAGCTRFLELGPGRVLTGLVRQINPDAELATADSYAALEAYSGGSQE
jgi:[acyl-carrier-protein] S-malonyltransferase